MQVVVLGGDVGRANPATIGRCSVEALRIDGRRVDVDDRGDRGRADLQQRGVAEAPTPAPAS